MIKVIVFDFDGVIIKDSESIKRNSWESVFPELGNRVFGIVDPLIKKYFGGKGSRIDIIHDVCSLELGFTDNLEESISNRSATYNKVVQESILSSGVASDDILVLNTLLKKVHLFLNTATPIDAIDETIKKLNIGYLFKGVFGRRTSTSKVDNLKEIMNVERVSKDNILFVGDSMSDYYAAKEVGIRFIGFKNSLNKFESEHCFPVILSLAELLDIID